MRRITMMLALLLALLPVMFISIALEPHTVALSLTPTQAPIAQFGTEPVDVYAGAGTEYPVIGTLFSANAGIIGRTHDNRWYHIRYSTTTGWVHASQITTIGNLSALPVESGIVTPTPLPITPSATIPPRITATMPTPTASYTPAIGRTSLTLIPTVEGYTAEQLAETVDVLRARLVFFGVFNPHIEIKDDDSILVEFPDTVALERVQPALTTEGYFELISLRDQTVESRYDLLGTYVSTTGRFERIQARFALALNGTPTPEPSPVSTVPPSFNPTTGMPYSTLADNVSGMAVSIREESTGLLLELSFTAVDQPLIYHYAAANPGAWIGVVMDGRLIDAPVLDSPDRRLIVSNEGDTFMTYQASLFHAMIITGPLAVPLTMR